MPTGVPKLGQAVVDEKQALEQSFPGGEVLGEIKAKPANAAVWTDEETQTQIQMEQGPPPWETASRNGSDARNFLDCPDTWVLRWINPKLLAQEGWRGWEPVKASDKRVKIKVPSMVTPENNVRRGGPDGDILAKMPREWYEKRKQQYYSMVRQRTQASIDKTQALRDEVRRIHPGFSMEGFTHPTHTIADGRTMLDQ